jgi:predicted ABC-type ATPase
VVIRILSNRDPTKFSDYSISLFYSTIKDVDIYLQKAHLDILEHGVLQDKIRNEYKRQSTSRQSIYPRGKGAVLIDILRLLID